MELTNPIASSDTVDIYRQGDKSIKLFRENMPKTAALYEALTHARIEATDLCVPKIHEVTVIDGRWAIIMDYIEGKTYAELMKEHPEKANDYLDEFVEIQLEIHSQQMPKLSKLKDKMVRMINSVAEIDDSTRYELLTRLESRPKHTKLCHCNYTPENVIISGNQIFILDWVAARQGNASADVANSYLLLSLKYPGYAERYLDLFCEKTFTSKKYVQEWLPIVAASRLTLGIPEEKELLNTWINVAWYE